MTDTRTCLGCGALINDYLDGAHCRSELQIRRDYEAYTQTDAFHHERNQRHFHDLPEITIEEWASTRFNPESIILIKNGNSVTSPTHDVPLGHDGRR